MKYFIAVVFLFISIAGHASEILERFYQQTQTMTANFEQIIIDNKGNTIEKSNGMLAIVRPDKFSLDYQEPLMQRYISNGKTLWMYDEELEQVTIKPLDEGLGDSPALLISSNQDIHQSYQVKTITRSENTQYQWVELRAKKSGTTFEKVLLGFEKHILMTMELYDNFGQQTVMHFSSISLNKVIPGSLFEFIPPEGVDVIGKPDG